MTKRLYFRISKKGKCNTSYTTAWRYTDKYNTKKALKERYGHSGQKVEVYTEEQITEKFLPEYAQQVLENAMDWNN